MKKAEKESKMPINIAKNSYLGKEGITRMNCAQAVINAFKEKYDIDDDILEEFKSYGSGKAPEGMCGAYYATKYLLEKSDPDKSAEFEQYFTDQAGSVKCHDIKANKKLSCLGCVEKSAEYLDQ